MARNTKRLFRAFTTKSSRGEKWRKSTTHSVTRVARVPHGPGAPKLIKWRFSSAHRRRFGSFPPVTTNTTGQLAVHMEGHGEEGGGTPGSKVEGPRGAKWGNPGDAKRRSPRNNMKQPVKHSGEEGGAAQRRGDFCPTQANSRHASLNAFNARPVRTTAQGTYKRK